MSEKEKPEWIRLQDAAISEFKVLAPEKRTFALAYMSRMVGSWGDLWDDDEREWHYRVLKESVGEHFMNAFKADMDARKKRNEQAPKDPKYGDMVGAESAYRDFDDRYEEAEKEMTNTQ